MANSIMDEVAAAKRAIAEANAAVPNAEDPAPATEPAQEDKNEDSAEDGDGTEQKAARTAEEVDTMLDDHEARIKALEDALAASTAENAAAGEALKEATATIRKLSAVLRDPAKAQALSRGEDAPAAAKTEPEGDVFEKYLALKPDSAEAAAFYRAHAAEIAAAANARKDHNA